MQPVVRFGGITYRKSCTLSNGQFLSCLLPAGNATEKMVMSAYELNNFIFILARVPQIRSNYKVTNSWQSFAVSHPDDTSVCLFNRMHLVILTTLLDLMLQAKGTGQLSLITSGMSTAGAVARIFTSIQEGAGLSMVRGFCIGNSSPVSGSVHFISIIAKVQISSLPRRWHLEFDNHTTDSVV